MTQNAAPGIMIRIRRVPPGIRLVPCTPDTAPASDVRDEAQHCNTAMPHCRTAATTAWAAGMIGPGYLYTGRQHPCSNACMEYAGGSRRRRQSPPAQFPPTGDSRYGRWRAGQGTLYGDIIIRMNQWPSAPRMGSALACTPARAACSKAFRSSYIYVAARDVNKQDVR